MAFGGPPQTPYDPPPEERAGWQETKEGRAHYRQFVHIQFDWEGLHQWVQAPATYSWLRDLHRHRFYAKVRIEVKHGDRELEFFQVLDWIHDVVVPDLKREETSRWSCEAFASYFLGRILGEYGEDRACRVIVLEDNENGGEVSYEPS